MKKNIFSIAFASDHRGVKLKEELIKYLTKKGYKIKDFGTYSEDSCDYPDYIYPAVKSVQEGAFQRAIVLCYTGIGSAIIANKVKGIRAALVDKITTARLSRRHNDSNVLVLPAGFLKPDLAKRIVGVWLVTEFDGGRHARRLNKIHKVEEIE